MWNVSSRYNIQMTEGDFGIELPVTVSGADLGASDCLKFVIKTERNGETVLEKDYAGIEDNTIRISLTESETEQIPSGAYVYSLDWYQSGTFQCNVIPSASFKVVDKA